MRKTEDGRTMLECDFCGAEFQFGEHRYLGKYIGAFKLKLCTACFETSWDGIGPVYEACFEAHLLKHGIDLPERRANDLYPRE